MKKPHKHAELIKAWADGDEIQYFKDGKWFDCRHGAPAWDLTSEYRIKPVSKPDIVRYAVICDYSGYGEKDVERLAINPNLKIVIDGETGKLKSAEVV